MIVSHEWLKQFVPHNLSAQEVGDLLSRHTVTLDGVEAAGADLSAFVVAQVVEAGRHPDSDHLWVTKVDDGSGTTLDVVCGAPNVVVGTKYPFARTGTKMPAGITIEKRKIRGRTSNGMLCSARELGLGEEHDGILALDTDVAPGTALLQVIQAGDYSLNLDVLPNRPDLLSHRGVAREISALTAVGMAPFPISDFGGIGGGFSNPATGAITASQNGVTVSIDDLKSCPQYCAVIIRGVKVTESPAWLRQRLESIGVRSISNVVDFTNYVLHGLGQPIHAFDLGKLSGSAIVVRPARDGESLVTLDGVERKVETGTTVICDGARPVALAGVMGGRDSEVTETTTDLLIEIASFDSKFVRKVRRAVNLTTDASYRFERGVDGAAVLEIAMMCASGMTQVAGGEFGGWICVGGMPSPASPVNLRPSRVSHLIGAEISVAEITRVLTALGCKIGGDESVLHVISPSWRNDLGLEVDLIEEVARMVGFDNLPNDLRATRPGTVPDHPLYVQGLRVRDTLVSAGLAETRPMPFTKVDGGPKLRVRNPLADDEPFLRQSLLETLARRAEFNLTRMQGNVRLFEIGNAFLPTNDRLPREETRAAALIMGLRRPPHFTEPQPPAFDMWDAKALAEQMCAAAFPGEPIELRAAAANDEHGALWSIIRDPALKRDVVGYVGKPKLDLPVWASDAYGVELTLGEISSADVVPAGWHAHVSNDTAGISARKHIQYKSTPATPAAEFDLALLVPDDVSAAAVEAVLKSGGGDLLENVALFDEFRGNGVPAGFRSVAWHLTFRHPERTLKEKEIEGRRAGLLQTLSKELGIKPRAV
ncbi:MAG: phenylalanine--tRNA ligase subunit beta [Gemmatimonadaceae bacterium]